MVEKPSADVREFARMWFSGSMLARLLPVCLRSFRHAAVNLPLAVLALSQFHLLCWGRLSTHEPWGRGGRHRAVLRRRSPACHGEDRHERHGGGLLGDVATLCVLDVRICLMVRFCTRHAECRFAHFAFLARGIMAA
ncbi:unnamed protein product [Prorocentrum cordatum]|uniref:Uncharacterized protein n=2 Tax=Prorocentrum cordatum TaxID=2364126 RepID=A0ABN9V474_9DINO|nr:unnamed protein product [Polarella glacialis]